jgi:hypothetical protein
MYGNKGNYGAAFARRHLEHTAAGRPLAGYGVI